MASSSTKRSLSNRGPSLLLLALACTVTFSLAESEKEPIQLSGEVGGNVTFQCPVDSEKTIRFFYFQRHDEYVNGYHTERDILKPIWENTRVDRKKTHVHMYRLNISHTGTYTCIIYYKNGQRLNSIQLNVTAPYSKPNVTQSCDDARCSVTCAFYGGYPGNRVEWKIDGSGNTDNKLWHVENNTQVHSPSTMLVNSSSTVYFNCSHREIRNLSCSVGNVISDWFPVCDSKPEVKPNSHIPIIIAGVAVGVVLMLLLSVAVVLWSKKRQTGPDRIKDGNDEEVKDLQELEKGPF